MPAIVIFEWVGGWGQISRGANILHSPGDVHFIESATLSNAVSVGVVMVVLTMFLSDAF